MGSDNSKAEYEGRSPSADSNRRIFRQRVYTEGEVQSALENQKRLYDMRQRELQNRIYPNLQTAGLSTIHSPSTSTAIHYNVTPSAPPETLVNPSSAVHVSRETNQTSSPSKPPPAPRHAFTQNQRPSSLMPSTCGFQEAQQQKRQNQRARSSSRANRRETSLMVNCVTCSGQLGVHIYQCMNGHSSCDGCRFRMMKCGKCFHPITDMRNITLESTIADMSINNEENRVKCPNAQHGCHLHFKMSEMENHNKECPFNEISCPVAEINNDCNWKGMIKQIAAHFKEAHPEHCEANVNKEMTLLLVDVNYKVLHLIKVGTFHFLVHIKLDTAQNNMYMVTQFFGTTFSASKWTYELHLYNKREPRRKFQYVDVCASNATPTAGIFDSHSCAVIDLKYAKTFLDCGKLCYKVYIKKNNLNEIN